MGLNGPKAFLIFGHYQPIMRTRDVDGKFIGNFSERLSDRIAFFPLD